MDRPFYYRSAEDVIPRDAAYVIIGGSVTVVPPGTFRGYPNLARVELQEGVKVIGRQAFAECHNLTCVKAQVSSLRTIDDYAFAWCERLLELILQEGIQRIGSGAFQFCGLEQIAVPSSVVEMGKGAFTGCVRLSEASLAEGLLRIGAEAFYACGLRKIAVPSSVVEIRERAFDGCNNLAAAILMGGMVMVATGTFSRCPHLDRIEISSVAIVVEAGGKNGNGTVAAVTGVVEDNGDDEAEPARLIRDRGDHRPESARLILSSRYLALMSQEDRATLTDSIDQIVDEQTRGIGWLDLEDEGVANRIRRCFANCLAEYKAGVAAVLELALWKTNMNQEVSLGHAAKEEETARVDAPTRDDCRRTCGTDIVIGPVLSYLWGPHCRADQEENGGPIQPCEGTPPPASSPDCRRRRMTAFAFV